MYTYIFQFILFFILFFKKLFSIHSVKYFSENRVVDLSFFFFQYKKVFSKPFCSLKGFISDLGGRKTAAVPPSGKGLHGATMGVRTLAPTVLKGRCHTAPWLMVYTGKSTTYIANPILKVTFSHVRACVDVQASATHYMYSADI